ncbi:hypothetical protein BDQ12DRAFT_601900 [Crucibulum laeve]|uniref:Uncharacterized protein n=1 Tax=Crucibulum laeve TaxID=68775 RepID=A0A5C3M4M4_9AGAR|nr:hypothetical protein BDQ12DRAFT_601900 [Crucibulum laeve]
MSELDSLSDSEWLDIASNREYPSDNESVSSQDSDHDEIGSLSRSRRSSISLGSSIGGDVEAWEGFVDDSEDEAAAAEMGTYPVHTVAMDTTELDSIPTGFIPDIEQPEEDQRVNDALDQSLVSTLSASRSSTSGGFSSTHTSIRDLRLSFPDPLTSSRDELNRSYEDVSTSDTAFTTTDAETDAPSPVVETQSLPKQDPGLITTTPEVPHHEAKIHEVDVKAKLDIILYGWSSSIKWSFVEELVKKAASVSGHTLINTLESDSGPVRTLRLKKQTDISLVDSIAIHDRTEDPDADDDSTSERPSLAIVYLPSTTLPNLAVHTAYIPVFVSSPVSTLDPDGAILSAHIAAEDDWDLLSVSADKTLHLNEGTKSPLFDSEGLLQFECLRAYHVLQGVIDGSHTKKAASKSVVEQLHSRQAVTLFALMSLIMGFAINTAFRPSTPIPTPTTVGSNMSSRLWGLIGPEATNRSAAVVPASTIESSTSMTPSSLRDYALAVFNPGSTALSVTSKPASLTSPIASSSKLPHCRDCKSLTLSYKPTDVTVHADTSPHAPEARTKPVIHVPPATGRMDPRADPTSTAVSLRMVTSLSEVVDVTMKAVRSVVKNDLKEVDDALEELMNAIRAQTQIAVRNSKGKARALGEQVQAMSERVQYRHDRARSRARELKKKGEELLSSASEQFIDRTNIAKSRARELKDNFTNSRHWSAYQKAHREWVAKLKERDERRNSHRRTRQSRHARKDKTRRRLYPFA